VKHQQEEKQQDLFQKYRRILVNFSCAATRFSTDKTNIQERKKVQSESIEATFLAEEQQLSTQTDRDRDRIRNLAQSFIHSAAESKQAVVQQVQPVKQRLHALGLRHLWSTQSSSEAQHHAKSTTGLELEAGIYQLKQLAARTERVVKEIARDINDYEAWQIVHRKRRRIVLVTGFLMVLFLVDYLSSLSCF